MKIIGWIGTALVMIAYCPDTSSHGASAYQLADLVYGEHATPSLLHN
jgi:hypothetical protein